VPIVAAVGPTPAVATPANKLNGVDRPVALSRYPATELVAFEILFTGTSSPLRILST
jgi:hypothetical protein